MTSEAILRTATLPPLETIPGLVHGFERRRDAAGSETRDDTRRRVASALSGAGELYLLKQVHGRAVRHAPWQGRPEGDAAIADRPGLILGIETADCLPVLLVDPRRRAVAAAHAGWRGTAAGVAGAALAALVADGSRPQDVVAALGPAIGPCCYEVGGELRAAFGPEADAVFRAGPRGKPCLDLREANRRQLAAAGLAPEQIHSLDECTRCRAELYHSYRREGRQAGRMVNVVGWRKPI